MQPSPVLFKSLALAAGGALLYAMTCYPMRGTWLAALLAGYGGLLCWRPEYWLPGVAVLLPTVDLAPWTGWFFFEETDLLLLATVAIGYWRWADVAPQWRLSGPARCWVIGFSIASLIGLWRGGTPWPLHDFGNHYLSSGNSLRVGKAWLWAMLLLPLLQRAPAAAPGGDHHQIVSRFIPAMLGGLVLVSLACLWERVVFPGLLNFSSDYRISAPFSAMHTGGAALDGYLALTFPLSVNALLAWRRYRWRMVAIACFALALHAGLATFSRGLYAAYAVSALLLTVFGLAQRLRAGSLDWRRLGLGLTLLGCLIVTAGLMFAASGYRGLAAALALLAAAAVLAALPTPWRLFPAALMCATAMEFSLFSLPGISGRQPVGMIKLPYLLFTLSCGVFCGALGLQWWRRLASGALATGASHGLAMISFCCLGINTLWIAAHWAGLPALGPAMLVVLLAGVLVCVNRLLRPGLWQLTPTSLTLAAAGALLLMVALPIGAGYYTNARFASSASDLALRMRHWNQALAIMDDNALTPLLGQGLGRFPATYFWRNRTGETPATLQFSQQHGNGYVQLGGAHYAQGYGEVLRLLQRITLRPQDTYLLQLDARTGASAARLHVKLCQRLLLYPQNCITAPLGPLPADRQWHGLRATIAAAPLGSGQWPRAPVQLEVAAEGQSALIDIDNLSLQGATEQDQAIRNGNFERANDGWFFSSDRHHLPWHIKNLALNVYFELGWLGVVTLGGLIVCACTALTAQARHGHAGMAAIACGLTGFLVVGLFDSLLDVPRLALLFYLTLLVALAPRAAASAPRRMCGAP